MSDYLPSTIEQRATMLRRVGVSGIDELYADVPASLRENAIQTLPEDGVSECAALDALTAMAQKNVVYRAIFRGAGAYWRVIPPIVKRVTAKEAFVTAYTPYQPEISQGVLQSIFEYQTMICELTGMDVSNASVYDGATAAAEAAAMCIERARVKTLVTASAREDVRQTMRTYAFGTDAPVADIPARDGQTDLAALAALLDETVAGVYIESPNRFGVIEDVTKIAEIVHAAGAKLIVSVNALAAPVLKTPRECGADIAVGDGQPLGMPLSFGGPYLGYMACTKALTRRLPGRIVGQTKDRNGARCFVLTLQAREQHIRREKASSNICSNQALCAMTAAAYMASMGESGMREAAEQSYDKAHYLAERLAKAGFTLRYPNQPFFHEFVTTAPASAECLNGALAKEGVLGGLALDEGILWCATERNTREQIDLVAKIAEREANKA